MQVKLESIFSKYAINLSINDPELNLPLRDHSQIPYIIDTLIRKDNHHLLIHGCTSEKFYYALMEAVSFQMNASNTPQKMGQTTFIYFDIQRFHLGDESAKEILQDFTHLNHEIELTHKTIVLILNNTSLLESNEHSPRLQILGRLVQSKLFDANWRIIALSSNQNYQIPHLETFFNLLRLNDPTYTEMLSIVKNYKNTIESYHQILIPDEVFTYALSLSSHYLGGKSSLDKTLDLLDSGAARASLDENPILTTSMLTKVASSWSHIPSSYLHHNKFKLTQFIQYMQQKIFGQDTAINSIGSLLQTNCINLKNKSGPICNLLLTGPSGVGKNELCQVLSEYLFSSVESLLYITPHKHSITCLSEIFVTIQATKIQHLSLLEAIQTKPYAVICFEDIDDNSAPLIDLFKNVFIHGYGFDKQGNIYDFRHTIIIINTTLGAERIENLAQTHSNKPKVTDLMQLVLNESPHTVESYHHLSQQDIYDQIMPCLSGFSQEVLRHLHIIPFVPLDQYSLEKIIQIKIHKLAKSLEREFGFCLSYAAEVIKFLTQETVAQKNNAEPLTKLFEQHVYSSMANEILTCIDDKNRSKHLTMLLNESGQILRFEFITPSEIKMYNAYEA